MKKISVEFALSIIQRNIDKGYIDNLGDDSSYELGYACCLKDLAFLLLGDDEDYGIKTEIE